jgi:hypothetical protein
MFNLEQDPTLGDADLLSIQFADADSARDDDVIWTIYRSFRSQIMQNSTESTQKERIRYEFPEFERVSNASLNDSNVKIAPLPT